MPKTISAKQLKRYFRQLPDKYKKKYMRQTMTAGAKPLRKEIKSNIKRMVSKNASSRARLADRRISKKTGKATSLFQSVATRVRTSRRIGPYAIVGPRFPDGAHGHLVERGHEIVPPYKKGKRRKARKLFRRFSGRFTRPIPFQRTAERTARNQVVGAMAAKLKGFLRNEKV